MKAVVKDRQVSGRISKELDDQLNQLIEKRRSEGFTDFCMADALRECITIGLSDRPKVGWASRKTLEAAEQTINAVDPNTIQGAVLILIRWVLEQLEQLNERQVLLHQLLFEATKSQE